MSRLGDWMGRAGAQLEAGMGLLNENEIFVRRARELGVLDRETALRMCATGPNLRASGVPFDIRRAHPYSVYPELEFDIPTRNEGDSLARYLLRMDEVRQSLRIIDQCLHQMPDGSIMARLPRLLRPRPGRAYSAVEGPRGQYACYAMSDGTDQPFRLRIHDPSFLHLQLVGLLMPGNLIADTMAIMASLDRSWAAWTSEGPGVMSAYWSRLSLGSRAILVLVPVVLVVGAVLTVAVALLLGPLLDFIGANLPVGRFVLAATALIVVTIPIAFLIIYMELKVIAAINLRVGPDRVGRTGRSCRWSTA